MQIKTNMQCTHVASTGDGHDVATFQGEGHQAALDHGAAGQSTQLTPTGAQIVITDPELQGWIVAGRTYALALTEA